MTEVAHCVSIQCYFLVICYVLFSVSSQQIPVSFVVLVIYLIV